MRITKRQVKTAITFACWLMVAQTLALGDKVWGGGAGDWFVDDNWVGGVRPGPGDSVVVTAPGSSVVLTNSALQLGSLVLGDATLTFSNNWQRAK